MSVEEEKAKLRLMEQKMDKVYLTIQGDQKMGISGIVDKLEAISKSLEQHRKESLENFKTFKRDIALDYVNDINDLDGRLKPIEVAHKKRHNTLGFLAGGGLFFGGIISNFDRIIKWFTE